VDDLTVARTAARAAANVIVEWFRRVGDHEMKGPVDPVTRADREAELAIVRLLETHRPGDAVLAEEGSRVDGTTGRRWVIDPLDGTVNFVHGIPQVAVSIALEDAEGGIAGVVLDVFRDEEFTATRRNGAALNGTPIRVSDIPELIRAVFSTGFAYDSHEHGASYAAAVAAVMAQAQGVRRLGSAALDLAWVACGRYEGHWEFGLQPWDLAAGALLVTEAGGTVTDSYGGAVRAEDVVATNGLLHEGLRSIVAANRPEHLGGRGD
jgi:myo-inositol-1(or 4)-monophosphatase